jgi:hypothetical protein
MAEVPEHLLKRAAERKAALEAKKQAEAEAAAGGPAAAEPAAAAAGGASAEEVAASNAEADKTGKIPAHLLARSQAAKAKAAGASAGGETGEAGEAGGGTLTTTAPGAGAAAAARVAGAAPGPGLVGAAGHTQRLLTVVKAGSSRTSGPRRSTRSTCGPIFSWSNLWPRWP